MDGPTCRTCGRPWTVFWVWKKQGQTYIPVALPHDHGGLKIIPSHLVPPPDERMP